MAANVPQLTFSGMFKPAAFAASVLLLAGCSDSCQTIVISRVDAPDGLHTAILFQRDCGATTDFSTQISVLARGLEPADSGNAFRADTNHGAAVTGQWGGPWADVRWVNNGTILVRYASGSRIFHQSQQVSGVTIRYEALRR